VGWGGGGGGGAPQPVLTCVLFRDLVREASVLFLCLLFSCWACRRGVLFDRCMMTLGPHAAGPTFVGGRT